MEILLTVLESILNRIDIILTIGIFAGIGSVVLVGLLLGLWRGSLRSGIRLGVIAATAALSFGVVYILGEFILPIWEEDIHNLLFDVLSMLHVAVADVLNASEDMIVYVVDVLVAMLKPLVFMLVFAGLNIVTYIIFMIARIFLPRGKKRKISRVGGMALSAIGGFIIVICLSMPITGYVAFLSSEYEAVEKTGLVPTEYVPEALAKQVVATQNNAGIKFINTCGGRLLFNSLSRVDGQNATDELGFIVDTVAESLPAIEDMMVSNEEAGAEAEAGDYTAVDLSAVRTTVIPQLEKASPRVKAILAEVLRTASESWKNGESFVGVNISALLGEEIVDSIGILLEELSTTNTENALTDLDNFVHTAEDLSRCLTYFKEIKTGNPKDLVSTGKQTLNMSVIREKIIPLIEQSQTEREFMASVIQNAAGSWKQGQSYLNVDLISLMGNYRGSADLLLDRLMETNADNLRRDLEEVSYDLETLSQTYVYFVEMQTSEKEAVELQENLADIVKDMSPEAVDVIKQTLTDEIVGTIQITQGSDKVMDLLGDTLLNITTLPDEEKQKEAQALNDLLNYATGKRPDQINEKNVIESIVNSDAIGSVIIDAVARNNNPETAEADKTQITLDEVKKAQLDAAIDKKLADANISEEQRTTLESLKTLFVVGSKTPTVPTPDVSTEETKDISPEHMA